MLLSTYDMGRQRRPSGPHFPVDKDWKRDIRARMERQGISQADLARSVGCKSSALTVLFGPETKQSRLVPAIHRALGLSAPVSTSALERDEARSRLERVWHELTPSQREILLSVAEEMRRRE